jgi:hypothetical protein
VRAALGLLAALSLGCNAMLGITDTTYRSDTGSAGLGGHAGSTAGLGAMPCTSNGECLDQSSETVPSACVAGQCVELLSAECPVLLPQTDRLWVENLRQSDPDPVIFGAFASSPPELVGPDALNYELMLTEVSHAVGGLPTADGKRRPVLALVCKQTYTSPDAFDRAIDHLMVDVQVPGILAGLEASDLEYAFRRQGHSHRVFFMSPYDADRTLSGLVDDGLVWEILSGGEQLAPAYQPLLDTTLEYLRRNGRLATGELARVALVTTDDVSVLAALSGALTDGVLQINGSPARDNAPDYFRAVSITSSSLTNTAPDYSDALQLLGDFAPHVIIGAATNEFVTTIIPAFEAENPDVAPFYLLSPWHAQSELMDSLLTRLPDLYTRIAGVNFAGAADRTIYDAYQARFDAAFRVAGGPLGLENFYDAGYYLFYAAAAASSATRLSGSDLASGMQRLLAGGPAFSVGPDDLLPAFTVLGTPGSKIVLNGAMGPPNFDPRTGSRDEPGSIWCVDKHHKIYTDVLRLDDQDNLTGSFPCFDFIGP